MLATMRIVYHVMSAPAPLGLLFLAATDKGVRHIEFMDRRSLKRTIAAHGPASPEVTWEMSLHGLRPLADQIDEMLTGTRKAFEWSFDMSDDPLQSAIATALLAVPYGKTITVAELARTIGRPRDTKLIADAVAKNPIAVLVPCHRVVGTDGKPLAYVGGLPRKKFLLDLEARFSRMGGLDDNRVIGELVRQVPRGVTPARVTTRRSVKHVNGTAARNGKAHGTAKPAKPAKVTKAAKVTQAKVGAGLKKAKPVTATKKPTAKVAAAPARGAARATASAKKRSR
jgi:AraC family transcriptional regulator of adaptative response/methylated-DNA-[protein]-cysteine methyltransferase